MTIYILPLIAALIGWLTNFLAVKMLFHPKTAFTFGPLVIHGVFPKRQEALAHKLGHIVSQELFSVSEITQHLKEKAASDAVMDHMAARLEEVMQRKLPQAMPMLAMLLNADLIAKIKEALREYMREMVRELIDSLSSTLEKDLDVHAIVERKVAAFSSDKLEEIIFSIMRKEFRFIELTGAVLGFCIGLIQSGLLLVTQ